LFVVSPKWLENVSKIIPDQVETEKGSLPFSILWRMRCTYCGNRGTKVENRSIDPAEVKLGDLYSITNEEARLLIESKFHGKSLSQRTTIYNQLDRLDLSDEEKAEIRVRCSPSVFTDGEWSGGFVVYANTDGQ